MAKYTQEQLLTAAKEVFGSSRRIASGKDLEKMYGNYEGSLDQLKRDWAGTPEAQKRGVDATKYGLSYVDPASLSESDLKFYQAYQRGYGKGVKMTTDMLSTWREHGSPERLEAEAKGEVKTKLVNGRRQLTISNAAWKKYGSALLTNLHKGEVALVEKGKDDGDVQGSFKGESKRWRPYQGAETQEGGKLANYYVFSKDPKKHSGVLGSIAKGVGLGEGTANSLDKAVGHVALPGAAVLALGGQWWALPFADEFASIGGGTRGSAAYQQSGTNLFRTAGLGKKDAERALGYSDMAGDAATSIGAAFADAVTFGAATAANQAMEATQRSQVGEKVDWADVGKNIATNWASFGITRGLGDLSSRAGAWKSAGAASAVRGTEFAWSRLGLKQVAAELARGGSTEDLAVAAGRGLVMGALPDKTIPGIRESVSFGLSYADSKRRGLDDDVAFINASAAAGGEAAYRMALQGKAQGFKEHWQGLRTEGRNILQGARGTMPAAWRQQEREAYKARIKKIESGGRVQPPGLRTSWLPETLFPQPGESLIDAGTIPRARYDYFDKVKGGGAHGAVS